MYCHHCGKELPDGTVFCHFCGTKQETAEDADTSYDQPEQSVYGLDDQNGFPQTSEQQTAYSQPVNPPVENVSRGQKGAFLGSLVGLIAPMIMGYFIVWIPWYLILLYCAATSLCALLGYKAFAGALSRQGIIFSAVMSAVMIFLGYWLCLPFYQMRLMDEASFRLYFTELLHILNATFRDYQDSVLFVSWIFAICLYGLATRRSV